MGKIGKKIGIGIILTLLVGGIGMIFGFGDSEWEQSTQQTVQKKEEELTLTKEQQENVVRWIMRGYEVQEVEFLQLAQNKSTGIYLLSFRINGDEAMETMVPVDDLEEFNENSGLLGLNPRDHFQHLEREVWLVAEEQVDISNIIITYLED